MNRGEPRARNSFRMRDKEFKRALGQFRLGTDEAGSYNNMGYVYYQAGMYDEARKSFQKAIKLSPTWYTKAATNLEGVIESAKRDDGNP